MKPLSKEVFEGEMELATQSWPMRERNGRGDWVVKRGLAVECLGSLL